jgi:hypothetical protein
MEDFKLLGNYINSFLNSKEQEVPNYDNDKMWNLIESSQVHYNNPISKPPVILSINDGGRIIPIFTKQNFSLFKGQAKSRKTFGLSMISASLGYNERIYEKFIPKTQNLKTLYIDTEQSDYHVYRFVNSVVNVSGYNEQSPNFWAIALRKFETEMRLKLVEFLIYNSIDLGCVIIDGIRDLVKDINSIDEAVKITDKLLKWTKEKNIHIAVVLHENPSKTESTKARGHLGTELTNKAETIIRFEKNKDNKKQTIITADNTRDDEFEPIYFEIEQNERGLYPVIVDNSFILQTSPSRF